MVIESGYVRCSRLGTCLSVPYLSLPAPRPELSVVTMNYFIFKPPITMVPDSTVDRLYMESHEFISGVKIDPIMRMSTFVNRLVESSFKLIALLAE